MGAKLSAGLSGVAGEYLVAGELSRRGYVATITLRTTENIDILASRVDGSLIVSIQVKTNQGGSKEWVLGKKSETLARKGLFYVFVNLHEIPKPPEFHIVESETVARFCRKFHVEWLAGKKKDGSPRKDTDMRVFIDKAGDYRNAWERLGLD